jgi:sugar lactone lactonase YvrE
MTFRLLRLSSIFLVVAAAALSRPAAAMTVTTLQASTSHASTEGPHLFYPVAVAVDVNGDLYVSEAPRHIISRIRPDGTIERVAGMPDSPGFADGVRDASRLHLPHALALASDGTLYIADSGNHAVRRLRPDGVLETVAGGPERFGHVDGPVADARFHWPLGIAIALEGSLIVAEGPAHVIRRITTDGRVHTLAGRYGYAGRSDGGGGIARLTDPRNVAVDQAGDLWITDSRNNLIRRLRLDGTLETMYGSTDSAITRSAGDEIFEEPFGIAIDAQGGIIVSEFSAHVLRRIDPGGTITTPAGLARHSGSSDGSGSAARFAAPAGIAIGPDGSIHVADMLNHSIRAVRESEENGNEGRRRPARPGR